MISFIQLFSHSNSVQSIYYVSGTVLGNRVGLEGNWDIRYCSQGAKAQLGRLAWSQPMAEGMGIAVTAWHLAPMVGLHFPCRMDLIRVPNPKRRYTG